MSSNVVGKYLRELRQKRGLTGVDLGRRTGLSQSKISKLETGKYELLQPNDVEAILNILEAPNNVRRAIVRELESSQPQTMVFRPYLTNYVANEFEQDKKAQLIRVFTLQGVPAVLQTSAFRMAVLRAFGVPDSQIMQYMQDANKRQDLLWEQGHSYHFILHQLMLYSAPLGKWSLLPPQFDRIERLMELPNVKIGIIPMEAGLPRAEFGPFALHDQRQMFMGSAGGDIASTDPAGIARYNRIFTELDQLALYGEPAKKLLHSVSY